MEENGYFCRKHKHSRSANELEKNRIDYSAGPNDYSLNGSGFSRREG